ncbi:inward rectifier potassium channel-domain-containing protein [Tribonema minus]|uniref:Inward rectifier potassium channel-domain-containing protein n=1 Tax=Tribonema minus TaxID=303371 RepID=A0A836CL18_9STRA|nr:inward rectifier potassium channel-domain-containing protein [Tribonema minus]
MRARSCRDSTYHQSYGRWNIDRNTKDDHIRTLFNNDRFHTVLHMTTWKVLSYLFFAYLVVVSTFALIYLIISHFDGCNMGIVDYREAYYFSLETMTTVGYGTQDVFFGRCWSVMVIITAQACCGLLIDALLIGVLFARLARPQTRASTVVFSNKAVLRRIRGEYYFMFQVGELRKHQLLETKVRCYAVRHHRTLPIDAAGCLDDANPPETVHYQTHNMRLQHPDDELGGALLLVLPQVRARVAVFQKYAIWSVICDCC